MGDARSTTRPDTDPIASSQPFADEIVHGIATSLPQLLPYSQ